MNLKKGAYFIIATGTDAGKTFLLTQICQKLRAKNIACDAIKPVASGFCDGDLQSDSAKILLSLGQNFSIKNVENITPWRFNAPIAPSIAARIQNSKIDFFALQNFCHKKILQAQELQNDFFFIEGAGGLMTPINDEKTFLDLVEALKIPVLLVAQNYLGAISHTLCALEALKSRAILVEKIIINDHQNTNQEVKIFDTVAEIARLSGLDTSATMAFEDFLNNF